MAGTVLVSGGSGYIAGYIIRQLVAEGWTVHTTIRDLAREGAVRKLLAVGDARLIGFGIVDVRDVADLHVRAPKAPGMAGKRFLASVPYLKLIVMPDFLVRIAALFNPMARAVVGELGSVRNTNASHAKAVLGWVARPAEESIADCARSLIELGIVKL